MRWQRVRSVSLVSLLVLGASTLLAQTPAESQKAAKSAAAAAKLEKEKKYDEALEQITEATKLAPRNTAYQATAARLAALAGKHEDGLQFALEALKLDPATPGNVVAGLRAALRCKAYETARDLAGRVVALGAARAGKEPVEEAKKFLAAQDEIDRHALKATPEVERSIAGLAEYLVKPAKDDLTKTRAIYRWVTDRVAYDTDSFFAGTKVDNSAEAVLKGRKCVCEGYASLFEALAGAAGLEVRKIHGYSKGYGYQSGDDVTRYRHAWNAVKLDDHWYLLDATWGAGYTDSKKQYVKRFKEYYFLTAPEKMILDHFPTEAEWQLLNPEVSQETYQKWPKVPTDLLGMGYSVKALRRHLEEHPTAAFVQSYDVPGCRVQVHQAPLERSPRAGVKQAFRLESADLLEVAVYVNGKKWAPLPQRGTVFEGDIAMPRGEVKIQGKPRGDTRYWTVLHYEVD